MLYRILVTLIVLVTSRRPAVFRAQPSAHLFGSVEGVWIIHEGIAGQHSASQSTFLCTAEAGQARGMLATTRQAAKDGYLLW